MKIIYVSEIKDVLFILQQEYDQNKNTNDTEKLKIIIFTFFMKYKRSISELLKIVSLLFIIVLAMK